MISFLITSRCENGISFRVSLICFITLRLFLICLVASMELCTLLMSSRATSAVLSTLGIGLDQKVPMTSLIPVLCMVSIILSADALAFINRYELYSSLNRMSALYICNKLVERLPHDL